MSSLASLRQLLAERFPTAARPAGRTLALELAACDALTGGGLPLGAITEMVCSAPSSGGHLLLGQVLAITRAQRQRVAWIDAVDSFDPGSYSDDDLAHLLWVRCSGAAEALAVTDLLARDANLGVVILDLRDVAEIALRRIPAPHWYRLQRAVESTDSALLVQTARPLVPSARLRLELASAFVRTDAWQAERCDLAQRLAPQVHRQRLRQAS